jgi:hypothetical protein
MAARADFSAEKSGFPRTQDLFRIRVLEREINADPEAEFRKYNFLEVSGHNRESS